MTASMLMPTVALAAPPIARKPAPPLVTSYGFNAWCGPDTFEEKCHVRIGEEGLTGTGTDITTVNQWSYSGQPYNMAEGVAGAVVGGAAVGPLANHTTSNDTNITNAVISLDAKIGPVNSGTQLHNTTVSAVLGSHASQIGGNDSDISIPSPSG